MVEALDWCNRYLVSGNNRDLNQAWDLYYHVFRRISRQLPQLTSLELQYVSPKLHTTQNMELAVPGSYIPGQPIVKIAYIQGSLQVITSKQRPRKLCIKGSDGNDYMFLLKGHEDLRQDERVMQLFGLVNTLLLNDPDTFRRNLTIQVSASDFFLYKYFLFFISLINGFNFSDMLSYLYQQIQALLVGFLIVTLYTHLFVITEIKKKYY